MRREWRRLPPASGFGAVDLIALIAVIFLLWLAALQQFPKYAAHGIAAAPSRPPPESRTDADPATPAAGESEGAPP